MKPQPQDCEYAAMTLEAKAGRLQRENPDVWEDSIKSLRLTAKHLRESGGWQAVKKRKR